MANFMPHKIVLITRNPRCQEICNMHKIKKQKIDNTCQVINLSTMKRM